MPKKTEPKEKNTLAFEIARLNNIYKDLPPNQYAVAQGLIVQAARLRIRLDTLWEDIRKNGETEKFTQSEKQTRMSASGRQQDFSLRRTKTIKQL